MVSTDLFLAAPAAKERASSGGLRAPPQNVSAVRIIILSRSSRLACGVALSRSLFMKHIPSKTCKDLGGDVSRPHALRGERISRRSASSEM